MATTTSGDPSKSSTPSAATRRATGPTIPTGASVVGSSSLWSWSRSAHSAGMPFQDLGGRDRAVPVPAEGGGVRLDLDAKAAEVEHVRPPRPALDPPGPVCPTRVACTVKVSNDRLESSPMWGSRPRHRCRGRRRLWSRTPPRRPRRSPDAMLPRPDGRGGPGREPPARRPAGRTGADAPDRCHRQAPRHMRRPDGLDYPIRQGLGVELRLRWIGLVVGGWPVEPDQGMEVDDPAALELVRCGHHGVVPRAGRRLTRLRRLQRGAGRRLLQAVRTGGADGLRSRRWSCQLEDQLTGLMADLTAASRPSCGRSWMRCSVCRSPGSPTCGSDATPPSRPRCFGWPRVRSPWTMPPSTDCPGGPLSTSVGCWSSTVAYPAGTATWPHSRPGCRSGSTRSVVPVRVATLMRSPAGIYSGSSVTRQRIHSRRGIPRRQTVHHGRHQPSRLAVRPRPAAGDRHPS